MATDPFDDIVKRVDRLSPGQKEQLLEKLQKVVANNGTASGRTLFDVFNDHGMIGSITDAPADWSSNPKHMEGFGQDAE